MMSDLNRKKPALLTDDEISVLNDVCQYGVEFLDLAGAVPQQFFDLRRRGFITFGSVSLTLKGQAAVKIAACSVVTS